MLSVLRLLLALYFPVQVYIIFLRCLADAWHLPAVFVPSALCCACLPSCDSEAFSESLLASPLVVKHSLLWKANYAMK